MSKETKAPDFASETAGEYWAQIKSEYGDAVSIDEVTGTGKDGAITKGDVEKYIAAFPIFESQDILEIAISYADEMELPLLEFFGEEYAGKPITDEIIENIVEKLSSGDEDTDDEPEPPTAPDFKEVKPLEGKTLVNLLENKFVIEGVEISPKGEVELTDALKKSKRVAHAINCGVLAVK